MSESVRPGTDGAEQTPVTGFANFANYDDDDDFGDFGGFEAADPMEEGATVSVGLVASPSPWAVLSPDSSQKSDPAPMPDFLPSQSVLSQNATSSSELLSVQSALSISTRDSNASPSATGSVSGRESLTSQSAGSISSRDFEPETTLDLDVEPLDIGLFDTNRDDTSLITAKSDCDSIHSLLINDEPDSSSLLETVTCVPETPTNTGNRRSSNSGSSSTTSALSTSFPVVDLCSSVSQINTTRALKSLESNQKELETLLVDLKQQLAAEKSRYMNLQLEHTSALENQPCINDSVLKHAVGECREQMRISLVEQQQMFQDRMLQFAEKSQDLFAAALIAQREEFRNEQHNLLENFQVAIEQIKNNFTIQLDRTIVEDREQTKTTVTMALQEQRRELLGAMGSVMQEERDKSHESMKLHVHDMNHALTQEKEDSKRELLTLLEEERLRSKNAIGELVKSGRELNLKSSEEMSQTVIQSISAYITQTKESDASLRKRQLESVNLTLQSAARQMTELVCIAPQSNTPFLLNADDHASMPNNDTNGGSS